jgi:hypothetical protein
MRKRKEMKRIVSGITRVLSDNKASMYDGAEVMSYLLVAGLLADGGHDKKEWLEWIEILWDAGEKTMKEDNVVSFRKRP